MNFLATGFLQYQEHTSDTVIDTVKQNNIKFRML